MKTTLFILMLAGAAFAGGNKKLMTQAESELRSINQKVLQQIPKDQIPENGRIQVTAKVKSTKPEPKITDLKVNVLESKTTTEGE